MHRNRAAVFRSLCMTAAAFFVLGSQAGAAAAAAMNFAVLARKARALFRVPFAARPELKLPKMEYEQFHAILFRPERSVWKNEKLPF